MIKSFQFNSAGYTSGLFVDGHIVAKSPDAVKAMYNFGSSVFEFQNAEGSALIPIALHIIVTRYSELAEWAINKAKLRILKQMVNLWKGEDLFQIKAGFCYCPGVGY